MFTSIQMFENNWRHESKTSQNVMDTLTDQSLSQAVASDHRTLGRMAWHIITSIPELMAATGLECKGLTPADPMSKTARELKDAYAKVSSQLLEQVKENWDDKKLLEKDELYGETWAKGFTLLVLIHHEIHHRGQMTVLMRQAGLKVPDIYGPAKEGWAKYGAPAPEI